MSIAPDETNPSSSPGPNLTNTTTVRIEVGRRAPQRVLALRCRVVVDRVAYGICIFSRVCVSRRRVRRGQRSVRRRRDGSPVSTLYKRVTAFESRRLCSAAAAGSGKSSNDRIPFRLHTTHRPRSSFNTHRRDNRFERVIYKKQLNGGKKPKGNIIGC